MAKKPPTFEEIEAEYNAARFTRKKDPARWNKAKHAYRQAEHDLDHPDTGGTRVAVQPAEVGIQSNN